MRLPRYATLITALLFLGACGPEDENADAGSAVTDSGSISDAGAPDAGLDVGAPDSGTDAGIDAGEPDAGIDAGGWDGHYPDTVVDAGPPPPEPFPDGGPLTVRGGDEPGGGVEIQLAQLFQVTRAGQPGGVGLTFTLRTDDNLLQPSTIVLDVIQLPDGATTPSNSDGCDALGGVSIATAHLQRNLLFWGVPISMRLNFFSNQQLTPGVTYALVLRSEHDSNSIFELAAVTSSQTPSPDVEFGPTLGRAIERRNSTCGRSAGWIANLDAQLEAYITLDDGCTPGETTSCGRGACFRRLPICDGYGNFVQCHRAACTTAADCRRDWNDPSLGTYPNATCDNPSGLFMAGTCSAEPETCNGLDDDCNGATDDDLPEVSCGLGACHTTVYGCENYIDPVTGRLAGQEVDCIAFEPPPSPEQCDAIDNDCNGLTDDHLPMTQIVGSGPCRRSVYSCILETGNTEACWTVAPESCIYQATGFGVPATPTPDWSLATSEVCNGIDDDCNGMTDEVCH